MHRCSFWLAGALGVLSASGGALAQEPVAIVEEATGSEPALQLFDTLAEGQEIALQDGGSLVIGYFRSCIRESISGGQVVIGKEESRIAEGSVTRETVSCAGGEATLADSEAAESGALVLRAPPEGGEEKPLKVFSATPIFLISGAESGELTIRRLDRAAQDVMLRVQDGALDLEQTGQALRMGGLYEARYGERSVRFEIDPRARHRGGPMIGRLVPL
ncbi:MAG: hypothetical protein WD489_06930 [Rhodovibrionaceae bacterium]